MQPLLLIAILVVLVSLIALESDVMRSQPQRPAEVQTR